jgi:hypothetical protein
MQEMVQRHVENSAKNIQPRRNSQYAVLIFSLCTVMARKIRKNLLFKILLAVEKITEKART